MRQDDIGSPPERVRIPELSTEFQRMGALRPTQRLRVCGQWTLVAEIRAVAGTGDHVILKQSGMLHDRNSIDHGHEIKCFLSVLRSVISRDAVKCRNASPEAEFIQNRR